MAHGSSRLLICIKEWDDFGVVVHDRVDVVNLMPLSIGHVSVVLIASEEAPTAIHLIEGLVPIHIADGPAIHGDPVACNAAATSQLYGSNFVCLQPKNLVQHVSLAVSSDSLSPFRPRSAIARN